MAAPPGCVSGAALGPALTACTGFCVPWAVKDAIPLEGVDITCEFAEEAETGFPSKKL